MLTTDMVGVVAGRLTVLSRAGSANNGQAKWLCRCDCGRETVVSGSNLRKGHVKSCGCLVVDKQRESHITHGMTQTAEYRIWNGMVKRCTNPRCHAYANYGGRGIAVCERWRSFENFYADMGPRPSPVHSIDRIDNDRGYEPGNVKWSTAKEQARNRRPARRGARGRFQ